MGTEMNSDAVITHEDKMLKKTLGLMMAAIMVFALAACGQTLAQNSDSQASSDSSVSSAPTSAKGGRAESTDGDLLEIEPKVANPTDYNETGDIAKAESDENARPEIANLPHSIDEYDTIVVGYPNWNADMLYIMYSFSENYDFSGKTIVPFMTHGGLY